MEYILGIVSATMSSKINKWSLTVSRWTCGCYRLENSSSLYWWYETFTCVLLFLFVSWFVLDFSVLCIFKGRSSPVVPAFCAPISCGLDIWGRLVVCGLFSKNVSFCGLFSEGVPVDPTLSDQSCGEPLLSLFYFLCVLSVLWIGDQNVCSALMYPSLFEFKF